MSDLTRRPVAAAGCAKGQSFHAADLDRRLATALCGGKTDPAYVQGLRLELRRAAAAARRAKAVAARARREREWD